MQFEVGRIWGKAKSTSDLRPILQINLKIWNEMCYKRAKQDGFAHF